MPFLPIVTVGARLKPIGGSGINLEIFGRKGEDLHVAQLIIFCRISIFCYLIAVGT